MIIQSMQMEMVSTMQNSISSEVKFSILPVAT